MSKTLNSITFLVALSAVVLVTATPALASVETDLFGSSNPLAKMTGFITGPFAFFLAIVAIVVAGVQLMGGNDMSGVSRRIPSLILGVGFILLAVNVLNFLFGGNSAGAILLPTEIIHVS
ncbi:TrbC/VirB2 family protein [uncultured Ruegeria sp.]|uniref:TrbC/VirB2 family protein n=1 Tax=uncultured Ruegeria sp. TaxID=259304 RepID=UPI00262D472E|nr:TrbC/VirB2 family protein [uncultured Ruegeria sp.]